MGIVADAGVGFGGRVAGRACGAEHAFVVFDAFVGDGVGEAEVGEFDGWVGVRCDVGG